ncbi:hypothetical protein SpCBS45565_g05060 [Spizellomyces sp. 'palustris']|nr:hypothetical protein SpCBS45565_g05060 [Spizellomyces sp. 'palustris']
MTQLDYRGKLVLAPMVRVGTLPMRLLALQYGADIVYSPETVDKRLIKSKRVVNDVLGTVDFVSIDSGTLTLRIHPSEMDRLVVQLGTGDPDLAVQAARIVEKDVAGIDVNCGCPKRFSLVSSMGAALLSDPDRLIAILCKLVAEVPLPITCKIRMLAASESQTAIERTIDLMKRIEQTGVKAIGVHCRFKDERPQDPGHWDIFEPIANAVQVPVIANGDIFSLADVRKLQSSSAIHSFMLARAPQYNVSVFRRDGLLPIRTIMEEYARTAIQYDMPFHNAKYCLLLMWPSSMGKQYRETLAKTKTYKDLCGHLGLAEFYDDAIRKREKQTAILRQSNTIVTQQTGELGSECPYIPETPDHAVVMRQSTSATIS